MQRNSVFVERPCCDDISLSLSLMWDFSSSMLDTVMASASTVSICYLSPGIYTRFSLILTLIAGRVYQALPNQNIPNQATCHLLFHGICYWLTSSDPSFILILLSLSLSLSLSHTHTPICIFRLCLINIFLSAS